MSVPRQEPWGDRQVALDVEILDCHAPFGDALFGPRVDVDGLLAELDELGITRATLVPQKPPGYHLEHANSQCLAAVKDHPTRLEYLCRVDPWQGERALGLLTDHLERGAVGLFLHPLQELFQVDDPMVDPLVLLCEERGARVMIAGGHLRYSTAWQIGELAGRFPGVTFVATSGGQINISGIALAEAETMLAEHPNVLMETSGIYREDFIEDMVARFGAARVVWGSGAPPYDRRLELARGAWAHLSPEDRGTILAGRGLAPDSRAS